MGWFSTLTAEQLQHQSSLLSNILILGLIMIFLGVAHRRGVNVYDTFVEGAKGGFQTAIGLIPYLLAMLVAVGVFRASGALDLLLDGVRALAGDARWVDALPTALMKPLSGSGARAMMIETMNQYGVDSFQGRMAATLQGSTENYVLCTCRVFWRGRYSSRAPRLGLRFDRGRCRYSCCDRCKLLVLLIKTR